MSTQNEHRETDARPYIIITAIDKESTM